MNSCFSVIITQYKNKFRHKKFKFISTYQQDKQKKNSKNKINARQYYNWQTLCSS